MEKSQRSCFVQDEISRLLRYPPELPIMEKREVIVQRIRENQVLVVTGETGSGKSTQIPKFCLEAGRGRLGLIGCTQPRRIAAITLSERVAEELGEEGRKLVGYKIRFQDRTAKTTRIKFMTDGILLAEAQKDRLFRAYDTLIVDEAHERTLNIDFLLGLLKKILPRRPDLKVIITSATIDPESFSKAFGGAPIVEVSGRAYPVEVWYRPVEEGESDEDEEESSIVDRAVACVDELKSWKDADRRGDILVFMPTESDIRETVQRLEEKRYFNTIVLPLFGRMASVDQRRIFQTSTEEKIVVATNVAETSITIPRIRYVVDTGLARISQYNVGSRTRNLPVTAVSQASADQRKGRCGRVGAGICIRLYSRDDYLNRPMYTAPEIQRSNLAEVILRMLYLRLGSIQEFPFLDPPSPAAVKDGFAVLKELGAVDEHRKLTPLGRLMARLPLDPRLARMIVEASREGALQELTVLAAVLSIQDPRERPFEQEAQADQVQSVFRDPRSDFVSLLKIWKAARESEAASRTRFRRFCRDHYLSYRRMREWKDIHEEIGSILEELGDYKPNTEPVGYEAIHRAILSGYLSQVAVRREKNMYLAARNRQVMLFPGSGLFNRGGAWIMAAELVRTSRLFARTAANIEPGWIEEIGGHLCRYSYSEPHWEKRAGQVTAFEKVTLYGLPVVERRKVNYSRIHPKEAREIFIRSALVEGDLSGKYGFLDHNRELIRRIEELESKARRRDLLVDEEAFYRFYDSRLPDISDSRSLDRFLKDQGGDSCLRMTEADLLRAAPDLETLRQFPDTLEVGDQEIPLRYAFKPGDEEDGVTVTVPVHLIPELRPDLFERPVPGMLREKIVHLLKSLPKSIRRQFVPVADAAQRLAECVAFRKGSFYVELSRCAQEVLGVRVPVEQWESKALPEHLRMRFEVIGPEGTVLGAGRDLESLASLAVERHEDRLWTAARVKWEREGIASWDFGDLPAKVEIGKDALGLTRYAYPALTAEGDRAAIRLFPDEESARRASLGGLRLLFLLTFAADLKYLKKSWVIPEQAASGAFFMGSRQEADRQLHDYMIRELFGLHPCTRVDYRRFRETVQGLDGRLGTSAAEILEEVLEVLREREETRRSLERFRKMAGGNRAVLDRLDLLFEEFQSLVPAGFLAEYSRNHIRRIPRYLRALRIRAERVYVAPEKDRVKEEQVKPYITSFNDLLQSVPDPHEEKTMVFLDEFRSMIEEFKISLFAPEMKTLFRVSTKRLDEKLQQRQTLEETRE